MPILGKPASAAYTSLIYITLGALTEVWSGIWYWYLTRKDPPPADSTWFWCYGFLLTGLVLLIIGLAIGHIGRAARNAELPPREGAKEAEAGGLVHGPVVYPQQTPPTAPYTGQPAVVPAPPVASPAPPPATPAPSGPAR